MSRFGWPFGREHSSPFSSQPGGIPTVTDDDFSYITSQDLNSPFAASSEGRRQAQPHSPAANIPEDDLLLIKNKGVTYPAHFQAYSIDDGKLRVSDLRERLRSLMGLADRAHIKLMYKGKQLRDAEAPVREYGVKNKSELMAVISDAADGSSLSEGEDGAAVGESARGDSKSRRRRKKRGKKKAETDGDVASSPRGSASNMNSSRSPPPPQAPSGPAGSGPLKQIEELSAQFTTKWLPLCVQYTASPPSDPKQRDDEHRKLSETLLQNILLKLDGVDTEGVPEVRAKRKELVQRVQDVLKGLDTARAS